MSVELENAAVDTPSMTLRQDVAEALAEVGDKAAATELFTLVESPEQTAAVAARSVSEAATRQTSPKPIGFSGSASVVGPAWASGIADPALLHGLNLLTSPVGFELTRPLGQGAMGTVFLANESALGRMVALKFLPRHLSKRAESLRRFRREAENAAQMVHENVVQVFSFHERGGLPFFAMEYVEGVSLEEMVRTRGVLPVQEALRIVIEAARGLREAHRRGIVHRDIKPPNVLITREGRVKVADFGIAITEEELRRGRERGQIAGTPNYMAPEQARGESATTASDIYSLGQTLRFALMGRPPVVDRNPWEVLRRVQHAEIDPIRPPAGVRWPPGVMEFLERATRPVAAQRFINIDHFISEAENLFLRLREPSGRAATQWFRRNKTWLAAAFAAAAVAFSAGRLTAPPRGVLPEQVRRQSAQAVHAAVGQIELVARQLPREAAPKALPSILVRAADEGRSEELWQAMSQVLLETERAGFEREYALARGASGLDPHSVERVGQQVRAAIEKRDQQEFIHAIGAWRVVIGQLSNAP